MHAAAMRMRPSVRRAAVRGLPRTRCAPLREGCKDCHQQPEGELVPDPLQRNEPCLGCHQTRPAPPGTVGAHDRNQLACTDCHKLHTERDAVLSKSTQPEVCVTCHQKQRADIHKASSHPLRSGAMGCCDCHNVHGSTSVAMLNQPTVNQTCFSCHADKRGPFLWEHAPAAEDCTLCHSSHGSVRPACSTRARRCCASSATRRPAIRRSHEPAAALPGGPAGGSVFLVAGSCTNCHSQVHGSNHPAGAKLMR
jgi:DmsE family decaheme c-type cytochrome